MGAVEGALRSAGRGAGPANGPDSGPDHGAGAVTTAVITALAYLAALAATLGVAVGMAGASLPPPALLAAALVPMAIPIPLSRVRPDREPAVWQASWGLVLVASVTLACLHAAGRLLGQRAGVLRLRNTAIYRETSGGGHTMGTTRMGVSPVTSVCDANQRVHGYDNLYLSGSSVFPAVGAVNPTLTIVALAYRLADHLARAGA